MKFAWLFALLTFVAALALEGCKVESPNSANSPSSSSHSTQESKAAKLFESKCYKDEFHQPPSPITRSVDFLFVLDTSGSLSDEKTLISKGISHFIQALPPKSDYQFAVMLAHGSRSDHSGRLWKYKSHPYVMSSLKSSLKTIQEDLAANLSNTSSDTHSDGGEEGLYSFSRGLDQGPFTSSQAHGFFRDSAALVVVFISDENDICAQYPAGIKPVADPENLEAPAQKRDCANITVNSILQKTKTLRNGMPFIFGAIAYTDPATVPRVGENEYGYGYLDLVSASYGIAIPIQSTSYTDGLLTLAELVSKKMDLYTEFELTKKRIQKSSLKIWVDGKKAECSYSKETNEIHLPNPGLPGSLIEAEYCTEDSSTPEDATQNNGSEESSDPISDSNNTGSGSSTNDDFPTPIQTPAPEPDPVPSSTTDNDSNSSTTETTNIPDSSSDTDATSTNASTDASNDTQTPVNPYSPGDPELNAFAVNGFDAAMNSNSAFLIWQTVSTLSTSQVYWGTTPELGNASILDLNLVQSHSISISNLLPNTVYYFQAISKDSDGQIAHSPLIMKSTKP